MDAERFAQEAGITKKEAERILLEAAEEKERIDEEFYTVKNMDKDNVKQLSIRVKCGTAERELTFPVPAGMLEWMEKIQLPETPMNNDDPMHYTVEGNRKIQISISLFDMRRKF